MEDRKGNRVLFVYDTVRRLWHKEDDKNIVSFARSGGNLYFLTNEAASCSLFSVQEQEGHEGERDFLWMCESSSFGYGSPDRKYVEAVQVRLSCEDSTQVEAFIEYDGDGVWHRIGSICGICGSKLMRIRPERCDTFRLRFEGVGDCTIRSVTKTMKHSSKKNTSRG